MAGKFADIRFNEHEMCFDASSHNNEADEMRHISIEMIDEHIIQLKRDINQAIKIRKVIVSLKKLREKMSNELEGQSE